METINVIIAALVTIFYLMLATRILSSFYRKITTPLNHATGILLIFTLIGFGINLHDFSEIAVARCVRIGGASSRSAGAVRAAREKSWAQ